MDEPNGSACLCETRPEQPVTVAAQKAARMVTLDMGISCIWIDARWPVSSTVSEPWPSLSSRYTFDRGLQTTLLQVVA